MRMSTFNDYLMQVDRAWVRAQQGTGSRSFDWRDCRGDVFYAVAHKMRPDLANRMSGTERDPRRVQYEDLDGWLGWFVTEWNRWPREMPMQTEGGPDGEG
jgi:hypothetical protein